MYAFYLSYLAVLLFIGSFGLLPYSQERKKTGPVSGPGPRTRRTGQAPLGHPDHPSFASARRRFVPTDLGNGG